MDLNFILIIAVNFEFVILKINNNLLIGLLDKGLLYSTTMSVQYLRVECQATGN